MDAPVSTEEIVIVAPRLPEAPGAASYSRYEIDEAAIEGVLRVDQALRSAPGVSLFRRNDSGVANATTQGLSIRAIAPSGAGRALVTLDGAPLNDPFGGWVLWGAIQPETLARATILRGAGAGPYGAGALTGAVLLEERREPGAVVTLESGDLGHQRVSGLAEVQSDALSLMLGASVQESDGWIPVRAARGAADEALSFESLSGVGRVEWRRRDLVLSTRASIYADERSAGLRGARSASDSATLSLSIAKPSGAFAWRAQAWIISSDFINASVALSLDRNTATPANLQYATPAIGWGGNAAVRWTGDTGGVEIGADIRAADGETQEMFLLSSGSFTRSRIAGGQTLIAGTYLEGWREAGDWVFTGGVRADQYRAFDGVRSEANILTGASTLLFRPEDYDTVAPTARLAARRDFDTTFFRSALYAGFRPPTLNELHRPFRVGNDVTEANASLKPERLMGADIGVGGSGYSWSWDVGIFWNRLEDPVVNVTLGAGPGLFPPGVFVPAGGAYRQRRNAGAIDAHGLEAQAHGASGALEWRGAITYTNAQTADGLRPAQSPEWTATAGVSWALDGRTDLSAALTYESARFEDDLNTRELASASVLDVRLERAISPYAALYATLDNALDTDVETAETATGVESFGPPRAFRIGLRLTTP